MYYRSVIFWYLNASVCNVYVLFSALLCSRMIRCLHDVAFLRNFLRNSLRNTCLHFFPARHVSTGFDRLRQVSTGFDKRRAHLPPPSFVLRYISRLCLFVYLRIAVLINSICV